MVWESTVTLRRLVLEHQTVGDAVDQREKRERDSVVDLVTVRLRDERADEAVSLRCLVSYFVSEFGNAGGAQRCPDPLFVEPSGVQREQLEQHGLQSR